MHARPADVDRELRRLVDEVTEVDWAHPAWRAFTRALALSESWSEREHSADRAVEAFVTALEANNGPTADTFMATESAGPPHDRAARIARAVRRAQAVATTLRSLDRAAPGQRLLKALRLDGGWLREHLIASRATVPIVFLVDGRAYVADVDPDAPAAPLVEALSGRPRLREVDKSATVPTEAPAAIMVDPVSGAWARSFHRLGWTRGGGPWMGVADSPGYAVVSTCHAAIDGYVHARISSDILFDPADRVLGPGRAPIDLALIDDALEPPLVGFASARIEGPPRSLAVGGFARALHAFASVLDRRLGDPISAHSVSFHVPIAPGDRADSARWRRRPLYGLLALDKRDSELESLESLRARLPELLRREGRGLGLLTRVLRGTLELPIPLSLRRRLVHRAPWTDRWFAPARLLTGAGYLSWMRFIEAELPALPMYPSAVPSFSASRGGAGLSIAPYRGGLAVGLTTSGSLGTAAAAREFLDEWLSLLPYQPAAQTQTA